MPLIRVTVQPSGMQKVFDVPEGGAPCDVLALQLKEEFGSGNLHHAGSNNALLPLANVYLQDGDYEYRTFAAAPPAAAAAVAPGEAGAAGGGISTPEARGLLNWLHQHNIDTSSLELFKLSIDEAPISYTTKSFFLNHTHQLPDRKDKCILGYNYSEARAVVRDDYTALLGELGTKKHSIVVATSPRRTGKTMGCVNSLLLARQQIYSAPDKLLVLATAADLPLDHLKTIFAICMHCALPLVLDELLDITSCAKGIKAFVEDGAFKNSSKPPLSVLLIGSEQQAIYNAAVTALSSLDHMGVAPVTLLPPPSLGLIVTMLEARRPDLQGDAFAGHVLSHLARSGQNLQEHWAGEPPTAEQLCTADVTELTYLPADLAHAVGRINTGSGSLIDQNAHAVNMLAKFGFIRPRKVAGKLRPHLYDYIDYRLITYQVMKELPPAADLDAALATAEGRVLEEVIRTEEGSMLLAKLLGLQESWAANQVLRYYGQLPRGSEVDMLLVQKVAAAGSEQYNLFLCSVKRSESQQNAAGFTNHMEHLHTFSEELQQQLVKAQLLTPVAISCRPAPDGVDHVSNRLKPSYTVPVGGRPKKDQQQAGQQQQVGQLAVNVRVGPLKRVLFRDILAAAQRMPLAEAYIVPCS